MAEERRRIEELEKLLAESKKREEESKKRYESIFGGIESNFIARNSNQ
jgi:cytidylate kinase